MIYTADFRKLIHDLLPTRLRGSIMVSWLFALIKPVRTLHAEFLTLVPVKKKEVLYNGQVIKLEYLLNERWDIQNGITIRCHTVTSNGLYIFDDFSGLAANITVDQEPGVVIYDDSDMNAGAVNFTVYVPNDITYNTDELKALINKYKMFGTSYSIVAYQRGAAIPEENNTQA